MEFKPGRDCGKNSKRTVRIKIDDVIESSTFHKDASIPQSPISERKTRSWLSAKVLFVEVILEVDGLTDIIRDVLAIPGNIRTVT